MLNNLSLNITKLIQSHNGILNFNYDSAVDWALNLLESGIESENIYMLASFSKPVDSREIKPYLSAVLKELNVTEKEGTEAIISQISYYLIEITQGNEIRRYLRELYYIAQDTNHGFNLMPFYLLYHAWEELDEFGVNFYYDNADKSNIENFIKREASIWLEKNT